VSDPRFGMAPTDSALNIRGDMNLLRVECVCVCVWWMNVHMNRSEDDEARVFRL
jgi:hypothetical protein